MIFGSFHALSRTTLLLGGVALAAACPADDDGSDTMNATTLPSDGAMTSADDDGADSTTAAAACGENPTTSYAADIQPIIEANCLEAGGAACHTPDGSWPTFDQSGGAASNYDKLVDANSPTNGLAEGGFVLVTACDLDNSYLWDKLVTGTRVPEGLCRMPISVYPTPMGMTCDDVETLLTQAELDLIEQWIMDGAPE